MNSKALLAALPLPAALVRGGRYVEVNAALCEMLGRSEQELLHEREPWDDVAPEQRAEIKARHAARNRSEPVPDDAETTLVTASGARLLARIHISPFDAGPPETFLFICEAARDERGSSSALIGGLVDAAVTVQRERTETGIFRALFDALVALGLQATLCEVSGARIRLLFASHPDGPLAAALRSRGSGFIDTSDVPLCRSWAGPQGQRIEDVPALLAELTHRPRADFAAQAALRGVVTGIMVEGTPAYALVVTAEGLDRTVASAFGLFCRQVGTALETVRSLDELARRNRELLLVNHVARATATLGSGIALQAALDHVADALGASSIALFRREDDQLTLSVSRGFPFGWATSNQHVPLRANNPWAEAAANREIIHYALEGDVPLRRSPRPRPPESVGPLGADAANEPLPPDAYGVAVPLQISDRVHGVLLLSRPHPPFHADELELLATVSAQLAVNLQNEVLFDQSQRRVSELSLLLELGQAVVSTLDLNRVLAEAARVAVRMLRCSAAYVMLPDDSQEALICAAGADPHVGGALVGTRVPLGAPSMSGSAFRTLRPQATADPRAIDPVLVAEFGCLATLAVPLHRGGKALGVLCLIERSEPRVFDPQEVRLASHAANLISVALENARLYADQRARAEEMARSHDLSRSLVGAVELHPILRDAARTLRELIDASDCFIFLLDRDKRELFIGAGPPVEEEEQRKVRVPIDGNSQVAVTLRARRPTQLLRARGLPNVRQEYIDRHGDRSMLFVPLFARDEVLGVVLLDDTRRERVFTAAEVERVQAVCGQIALAMLAARLVEDLRRSYAELARTQAELVERERLAVVGELSASIAHEVRNPLGVVFNSLGSLRRLMGKTNGDVKLLLDIIGEEAERLNRMVDDLLDFARPLQPAVERVTLEPLVRDAIEAARAQHAQAAPVSVGVDVQGAEQVRADPRLLRQALVNLVLNALQALGRGGAVSITARPCAQRGGAVIAVADDGPGIPEAHRARVFQPFFTTKAKGTGLGLAVVKRIAEGHGGSLSLADRAEGEGSEFQLWLPGGDA
jgi:PAS domain S-box-containing protein